MPILTVMAWPSTWRYASRGSRRPLPVGCSTTTSGSTILRWGGIRRVIRSVLLAALVYMSTDRQLRLCESILRVFWMSGCGCPFRTKGEFQAMGSCTHLLATFHLRPRVLITHLGRAEIWSAEKEAAVGACLARAQGKYSVLTNNCATPIQNCLRENGFKMPPNNLVLPESLNHFMWWMFDSSTVVPVEKWTCIE